MENRELKQAVERLLERADESQLKTIYAYVSHFLK
mgnify:CR=1 FL=1